MEQRKNKKVENFIRLNSEANFDAGQLPRHVRKTDDCKQGMDGKIKETLAGEFFTKHIVKSGSDSSVSEPVLYREDALAVLESIW